MVPRFTTVPSPASRREPVSRGEVQVWLARPDSLAEPERVEAFEQLMTADELTRCQRLRLADMRQEFRVARALVRTALSRRADIAPADWRFATGPHGRPEIAPGTASRLRFNISHCPGLVACAVTCERPVGVDVEDDTRPVRVARLARRVLSGVERATLHELPQPELARRFFTYWTLKESYLKARGLGLRLPLDAVSFEVADSIGLRLDSRVADDPGRWDFVHRRVGERHQLALCVERADEKETATRVHWASELGGAFASS